MKKIAILTSGGDSPGMNAAIRSVTRAAIQKGYEVYGSIRGYNGLIKGDIIKLERRDVSDIIQRGGTKLKTARSEEFNTEEGMRKAKAQMDKLGIEALVVIGGDGTFRGASDFYRTCGVPCIGIPGTIDNDLKYTDYTIGFDTAANTICQAINNLRDTMISHDRVCIVEVMGRRCGDLALKAGVAGGAEIILVPEMPFSIDEVINRIKDHRKAGKTSEIIVLAEGVCSAEELKKQIVEKSELKVWTSVLGHIQRGGTPTVSDRILAAQCGVRAVDLIERGKANRVIGIKGNEIIDLDIDVALKQKREFDSKLYESGIIISI